MASLLFALTMFVRHRGRLRDDEPWRSAGEDGQERIVVWTMWLSLAGLVLAALYLDGGR